jgi:hypothetical protein
MRAAACVWRVAKYFRDIQSRAKMFRVKYRGSETSRPRMFGVCLQECERWPCPYEASCDVFSELGPVGGPINGMPCLFSILMVLGRFDLGS